MLEGAQGRKGRYFFSSLVYCLIIPSICFTSRLLSTISTSKTLTALSAPPTYIQTVVHSSAQYGPRSNH